MKREVKRERELPAFSLNFGELEVLVSRLLDLFDDPSMVHSSINIRLTSEQLEFSSVQELREYKQFPARVTNFSLWFSLQGKRVSIRSGGMFATRAEVSASADTESWCAGAIDTAYTFAASHKVWYNWFVSAPTGWLLFILLNIPGVCVLFLPKDYRIDRMIVFAWIGAFVSLSLLYFGRGKLLPTGVIRQSDGGGFIRNHVAELSLAIAILSAVLTIVGWFVTK